MSENNSTEGVPAGGLQLKKTFQGKLNYFQKTMLQWNDIHPYNAVHVVRISAPLDGARLDQIINATLESHGLTGLTLNRKKGTFHYAGGHAQAAVKIPAGGPDVQATLNAELERQLNTGFASGGCFQPFRFFAVPDGECFFLGLVYFHAIADAGSIVWLLRDIFDGYLGVGQPRVEALRLQSGGFRFDPLRFVKKLVAFPAATRQMQRCLRPLFRGVRDFKNEFTFFALGPDQLCALAAAAKAWEITLNDLFLALLLKCLSPLLADRVRNPKRRNLAVGCIVNIRKDLGLDEARTFGLFLGSFVVTHELPAGISVPDLARDIRRQTVVIKRGKYYVGTPLEMFYGRLAFSFFSTEYRKKLYQKHYPLWGGITNMNLDALWPQSAGSPKMDYFRAISTGPVSPLVLSVTTVGGRVNLGLSHRSSVYSAQQAGQMKAEFLRLVAELKSCA